MAQVDWSSEDFKMKFFATYDTLAGFIRKYRFHRKKRKVNDSQRKHTRRRRQ